MLMILVLQYTQNRFNSHVTLLSSLRNLGSYYMFYKRCSTLLGIEYRWKGAMARGNALSCFNLAYCIPAAATIIQVRFEIYAMFQVWICLWCFQCFVMTAFWQYTTQLLYFSTSIQSVMFAFYLVTLIINYRTKMT